MKRKSHVRGRPSLQVFQSQMQDLFFFSFLSLKLKNFFIFVQFLKVPFHLQLLQSIGYIKTYSFL